MGRSNVTSTNPLSYTGIDKFSQPRFIYAKRPPTESDKLLPGIEWFDRLSNTIYITTGNGQWKTVGGGAANTGLTWANDATTTNAESNNGYIITSGDQVFTLPTASDVGDIMEFVLHGGTSWKIAQNASQSILDNAVTTTVGVGGSIESSAEGQTTKLLCIIANTKWQVTSSVGGLTVV